MPTKPPKWFRLEKYAEAKHLSVEDWEFQLFIRDLEDMDASDLAPIMKYGIVPRTAIPWWGDHGEALLKTEKSSKYEDHSVDNLWYVSIRQILNLREHIFKIGLLDDPEMPIAKLTGTGLMPTRFWGHGVYQLNVNLDAPDKILIKDFRQWLRNIRKLGGKPKMSMGEVRKLVTYRVLPLLDLKIWARLKKVKIKDDDFVKWVYEGQRNLDDFRKTLEPFAERALGFDFQRGLKSLGKK